MERMRRTIRKRVTPRARAKREVLRRQRVRKLDPVTSVFTFIIIIIVCNLALIIVSYSRLFVSGR